MKEPRAAPDRRDVIVIGAGAAGLAAAAALSRSGHCVEVLEARDRLGGRIWTRLEPGLAAPVELGAEFIHGDSPETYALLRQAGGSAVDTTGEHWSLIDGRLQRRTESLLDQVRSAFEAAEVLRNPDICLEAFLQSSAGRALPQQARAMARTFVSGFDAADPRLISLHSVAQEWRRGGMLDASQSRPSGGYHTVLQALAGALDRTRVAVRLQTVVTAVDWSSGRVEIQAERLGRPWRASARCAVITVPPAVLCAAEGEPGAIRFTPGIDSKRPALEGILCGPVLKVMLRFRRAFWAEHDGGRHADAAFFHSPDNGFPTLWTPLPLRAPLLAAWAGGPAAARLGDRPDREIMRAAIDSVAALFPGCDVQGELESAHLHNWARDPFARGAYSYLAAGGSHAREHLAAPLGGTLFFAGEATDVTGEPATVTGALRSAARAAHEVIRRLDSTS